MSLYRRKGEEGDVWWSRIIRHGIVHQQSTGCTNKTKARNVETLFKNEIALGRVGLGKVPTLAKFEDRFMSFIEPRVKNTEPNRGGTVSTLGSYVQAWKRFIEFEPLASAKLNEVKQQVEPFTQHLLKQDLAVSTVNLNLRILKRVLSVAKELEVIRDVPKVPMLPGEEGRDYVVSPSEEDQLLGAAKPPLDKAIPFLLDTGLRSGEFCSLPWTGVVYDATRPLAISVVTLKQRRGQKKIRRIPLTDRASAILAHLTSTVADKQGVIFRRPNGKPMSPTWITTQFGDLRDSLGLSAEMVLHSLRHTFGTRIGDAGANAFTVMTLMGHANVSTSAKYVHPENEALNFAIERLGKKNGGATE